MTGSLGVIRRSPTRGGHAPPLRSALKLNPAGRGHLCQPETRAKGPRLQPGRPSRGPEPTERILQAAGTPVTTTSTACYRCIADGWVARMTVYTSSPPPPYAGGPLQDLAARGLGDSIQNRAGRPERCSPRHVIEVFARFWNNDR